MFETVFEGWMLAMALVNEANRKEAKRLKELDRAEINAAYHTYKAA